MGKRELLLILAFAIAGLVIYKATAPPSAPGESSRPIGRLLDHVKRELRGNQAVAELARTWSYDVTEEVTEVWIRGIQGHVELIEVQGEERGDVEAQLQVVSRAYDDDEARQTAKRTVLKSEHAGASLAMVIEYPREGRQTASLTLKMPSRLRLRVDARPLRLTVSGVSGVEAGNTTGETAIRRIAGDVAVTHRNGAIVVEHVSSVKFTGRNSRLKLSGVRGDTSITFEQGGALTASNLEGPIEITSRHAEIQLDADAVVRGSVRVNADGGSVHIAQLKTEARLEGRNAEIDVTMRGAAAVTIYSQGEDVALTPPPAACRLDIAVTDGRIAPENAISALGLAHTAAPEGREQRASGALDGGGPTISVRASRGDVIQRVPSRAR